LRAEDREDVRGPEWQAMPCDALLLVSNPIAPALPLDYFGVYGLGASNVMGVVSDHGNVCSGALDHAACVARVQELVRGKSQSCAATTSCRAFTLFTRGDEVQRQDDLPALHAVLGDIDRPSEAVVAALVEGLKLTCPGGSGVFPDTSGTKVRSTQTSYRVYSEWDECSATFGAQAIDIHRDGTSPGLETAAYGRSGCTIGRRPTGLTLAEQPGAALPAGTYLAHCAQLEAASVYAFESLASELRQLGAADSLLAAARRSAADERRHTRQMRAAARRYQARALAPQLRAARAQRSAFELALENAVEGCVRETFGALLAWHQAALATDPGLARVMRGIAADETRHAELSWDIAAWLEPRLSAREQSHLAAARARALRQLEQEIASEPLPAPARAQLGLPSASVQRALLARMATQLGLG
jgi:hypothetical protein